MAKDIHAFRIKLQDKILNAGSEQAVVVLIDTAVNVLAEKNVHGHIIGRFIDKVIDDMEIMVLGKNEDTNRANAISAIEKLKKIKRYMTEKASI